MKSSRAFTLTELLVTIVIIGIAGYYSHLPLTPSHGAIRNKLFFDGHVVAVSQ